jgi:hypothetical protein
MQARPPPREPAQRARHDALVRALDDLLARARLGRYDGHATELDLVIAEARALAHPPLLADALLLRARSLIRFGALEPALTVYREAMPIVAAAGDPEREARAWIELVEVLIALHQRPTEDVMIATAAAVARAGNPPDLRRRLADFGATVGP